MKLTEITTASLVGFFVLLFSVDLFAYEVRQKSLQELFYESAKISKVRIVGADQIIISIDGKDYDCGLEYRAEVLSNFKGEGAEVVFRSAYPLLVGNKYLLFLSSEYLDARVDYLSMGKRDLVGYEACTEGGSLYASGFHGKIFEFDSLWETVTGEAAVKAVVEAPFLSSLKAEKVEFSSGQVPKEYLEALSYWRISWKIFEKELLDLSSRK
ncbi:hypothetical protein [Microbulbifer thermotolerans]|uniref:Uncharacterized protein n=1 Tax=Microbulbifer thermotolerans TaxID=252514 RepID=A0A143HKB7_MICTH|nr:hypothetical protein [Microbulbifer thermotolerans]AMX01936.1 hypothetical protein A3224_04455 [Microbulbifer thermotolerans]MCX2801514.1 hypothetical protein [Microbulbifer thermotolerans]SFB67423.1 hypothetical protein SAMN05660479_00093 [Microbulbifer thermotolerans]